jgi:hypothetical protein
VGNLSPNVLAVIAAIILGIVIWPWQVALSKVTSGQYLMTLGIAYFLAGIGQQFWQSGKVSFVATGSFGFGWAILASLGYVTTVMILNKAFGSPASSASIIGAIVAIYPAVTILTECLVNKRWPTLATFIFTLLITAGVAGLSLFGKKI